MNEFRKINADIEAEKEKTLVKKEQFIRKIKDGLGEHIKNSGGKIIKIKKSKWKKFWENLMKVF